jgi:hypothetical protein
MIATSLRWPAAMLLAVMATTALALEPPVEPVLLRAQRHLEALLAEDCSAQVAPALEFAGSAEFEAGLEPPQQVALLWQVAACAMTSRQFATALDVADRILAIDPDMFVAHRIRLYAGMIEERHETALDALQVMARTDPDVLRAFEIENVSSVLRAAGDLDATGDRKLAVYEALAGVGYMPPPPATDEFLRVGHARLLLERGRIDEARARLAPVEDVDFLVAMRIERLFDPLRGDPSFEARLDLAAAMERDLARSQASMKEHPGLLQAVYRHLQNLDKAQRDEEAVGLAQATLARLHAEPQAYSDAGEYEPWILNQLGYLLYGLGRAQEGAAMLGAGARLEERSQPNVSQVINLAGYLVREGRGADALALLGQVRRASPYGRAWIESLRSCCGVLTGDEPMRAEGLAYLQEHVDDNPPALMRALLCSDDAEGAAALMIRRLGNPEWRSSAILALQRTLATGTEALAFQKLLSERFDRLRSRADVLQALEPVGRLETIPFDLGGSN